MMTWKLKFILKFRFSALLFDQHIRSQLSTKHDKNMHILDEKLSSDFFTDDNNQFKLYFTDTHTGNKEW